MRIRTRIALVIVAAVLLPIVLVGGLLAWVTGRALPQTSGQLTVAGLERPVTVVRDQTGIVHITADTAHDLFLAQGYVHAQERMWQMEVWRHISSGRLSELFGASQLDTDRFIRTVGWHEAAERDLAAFAPDTVAILDAYTAGVNAWLDGHRASLGLAFLATGDVPEAWSDLDTVAWAKVQAWDLGGNMDSEIFRYLADAKLGDPARTDQLFPPYREDAPVITPTGLMADRADASPVTDAPTASGSEPPGSAAPPPTPAQAAAWRAVAALGSDVLRMAGLDGDDALAADHGIGSNDWVVAPALSTSGGALLANDPHLGISMPSIWFINGLHCRDVTAACPYDEAGVSFPGAPGIILGHNQRIAWGATNVDPDVQDLVIETPDPADPAKYVTATGSQPFVTRQETIRVKGGDPVVLDVRVTQHGPILNDVDPRLKDAPPMALRWTATQDEDHTLEAILRLDRATDFEAFRTALSAYGAPSQNFVYADVEGHIGYQLPGSIPIRTDPNDHGDRPVSGADGQHEWVGRVPFDELPSQYDPPDGRIVTANNAAVDADYPHFIGQEWDPGFRAERIADLLTQFGQDGLTLPEMGRIQVDTAPLRARDVGFTLSDLTDPDQSGTAPSTEAGSLIRQRIDSWDGACAEESTGCAAYMAWEYRVLRDTFDDELGPDLAREYVGGGMSWVALGGLLDDPHARWWDDVTTPAIETGDMIVARAMDEAGAELGEAFGAPDRWTWGRLHTATFQEQTLGQSGIGPLEWYFDDGPQGVSGTGGAIDATSYRMSRAYPDPADPAYQPVGIDGVFAVTSLPSYRLTIDMGDLDGARIVITTGQSGNPFDRHYNDQIDAWRHGGTFTLPFSQAAIAASAASTLTLAP